ncbi:MAG: 3-deoxy-8-phosphooctulonate synthase [Saprospiraceae bacterium]|nr:3-deoxy-8-phosphooctulonate synthase [Saprospiraceae bacterium]
MNISEIPKLRHWSPDSFLLIAGPCAIENESMPLDIAEQIQEIIEELMLPFVFKASYKKANRSRLDSFTGIGDEKALEILANVGSTLKVPCITDVHSPAEAVRAAEYVDVLQIPAFLCRQTELLQAAAQTGKWINIKKGQFLSPESMGFAVQKIVDSGNEQIMITERGTTFGYQDLVVDFRGFPEMRTMAPLVLDCTHSLQKPNQTSGLTGGTPALIETLAKAGIAAGADGVFIETHPNPSLALSDGANMLPLAELRPLMEKCMAIRAVL